MGGPSRAQADHGDATGRAGPAGHGDGGGRAPTLGNDQGGAGPGAEEGGGLGHAGGAHRAGDHRAGVGDGHAGQGGRGEAVHGPAQDAAHSPQGGVAGPAVEGRHGRGRLGG